MKPEMVNKKVTANRTLYYGKGDVFVYRTNAKPLEGIKRIPESNFQGRSNSILAMDIRVALKGDAFLSSFTKGDNSLVIATDSMKNFVLQHAGKYEGTTIEGFLEFVSASFLQKYPHISGVTITGNQIPFKEVEIATESGFIASPLVFRQELLENPSASLEIERTGENDYEILSQQSGIQGIRLIKVKGSPFYGYIQDEYTTLLETTNRPLFIYLNIYWKYMDSNDAQGLDPEKYVCAEQVAHIAQSIFHDHDYPSIQNLLYYIGVRVLNRFPQLAEVSFESNNRTWDAIIDATGDGKVYTDPRPPYGFQGFSMTPEDVVEEGE